MFRYKYIAETMAGERVKGFIDAETPEQATLKLLDKGLFASHIKAVKDSTEGELETLDNDNSKPIPKTPYVWLFVLLGVIVSALILIIMLLIK